MGKVCYLLSSALTYMGTQAVVYAKFFNSAANKMPPIFGKIFPYAQRSINEAVKGIAQKGATEATVCILAGVVCIIISLHTVDNRIKLDLGSYRGTMPQKNQNQ